MLSVPSLPPVAASVTLMAACILQGCTRGPEPKPVANEAPAAPGAKPTTPGSPAPATSPGEPAAEPALAPAAKPAAEGADAEAPTTAGGLRWTAQPPLKPRKPASPMRAAELVVEGTEGPDEVVLTVFHFPGQGGSVQANIDRWLGQIVPPDGRTAREAAKLEERQVGELHVTRVSVDGAFRGGMGPMQPAGKPQPDHRLLGAIADGPKGPVFFKLVGPRAVVAGTEDAFDALIGSLAPATH